MTTDLRQLFADLFQLKLEELHDELTPADLPAWDSLQHLNLVITIEEGFDVSLTPDEIVEMRTSFGAIRQVLASKGVRVG